ncbi:hypothetical protein CJ030_MR3G011103 [Morella rubra]|uniref:Uncharacterized protein n=1 Tax=Morella rubra TaxID=262757 RepID=A0A6A1W6A7_9ROSI|nr:hypothetical protein CJ030_MR3G011103 [Morella rubra]
MPLSHSLLTAAAAIAPPDARPPSPADRRRRPTQVLPCHPPANTTGPPATGTLCRLPNCLSTPDYVLIVMDYGATMLVFFVFKLLRGIRRAKECEMRSVQREEEQKSDGDREGEGEKTWRGKNWSRKKCRIVEERGSKSSVKEN